MLNKLPRILIVDDFPTAGLSLEVALRTRGYLCKRCVGGVAALLLLDSFRPGVVVLDTNMASMDGYKLAEAIRALPLGARYVLIAFSVLIGPEDRRAANRSGFDACYEQPAELNKMLGTIDYLTAAKDAVGMTGQMSR